MTGRVKLCGVYATTGLRGHPISPSGEGQCAIPHILIEYLYPGYVFNPMFPSQEEKKDGKIR